MSSFYEGIMQGLNEALAYTRGELTEDVRIHSITIADIPEFTPNEIREIRKNAGMTQGVFASCLGVTKKAVEGWEGGRSHPNGAVRRILSLMKENPQFADDVGIISR